MLGFAKLRSKTRVAIVKGWKRVLALPEDAATINILKDDIEVVRLIGESTVVIKNDLSLGAVRSGGNLNWLGSGQGSEDRWAQALGRRASPARCGKIKESNC